MSQGMVRQKIIVSHGKRIPIECFTVSPGLNLKVCDRRVNTGDQYRDYYHPYQPVRQPVYQGLQAENGYYQHPCQRHVHIAVGDKKITYLNDTDDRHQGAQKPEPAAKQKRPRF